MVLVVTVGLCKDSYFSSLLCELSIALVGDYALGWECRVESVNGEEQWTNAR